MFPKTSLPKDGCSKREDLNSITLWWGDLCSHFSIILFILKRQFHSLKRMVKKAGGLRGASLRYSRLGGTMPGSAYAFTRSAKEGFYWNVAVPSHSTTQDWAVYLQKGKKKCYVYFGT